MIRSVLPKITLYAQLFLSCFFDGDRGLALSSHDEIFQAFPSNRELTLRNLLMTFLSVTKEYIGSSGLEVKREKHPPLQSRWLKKGLTLLEEAGAEALTIELLTNRLDVISGE